MALPIRIKCDDVSFRSKIENIKSLRENMQLLIREFSKVFVIAHEINEIRDYKPDFMVVGIDGGLWRKKGSYFGIVLISTYTCVYTPSGTRLTEAYRPLTVIPEIIIPSNYISLVNSIKMKTEERKAALEALTYYKEILGMNLKYILLDGTLTFPEVLPHVPEDVEKIYREFVNISEKLFSKAKKLGVAVVGISKDPLSPKYVRSIINYLKGEKSLIRTEVQDLIKSKSLANILHIVNSMTSLLHKTRSEMFFTERLLISNAFKERLKNCRNKEHVFIRTLFTDATLGLRDLKIEVEELNRRTYGLYCYSVRSPGTIKPLFVEFTNSLNPYEVLKDLIYMFTYSLTGYPTPLLLAHRLVKLSYKRSKKLLSYIKNMIPSDLRSVIFEERFRARGGF